MVAFIRLQVYLFDWPEFLLTESVDLLSEYLLRWDCRIDTACFDRDHKRATVLDKHGGIESQNSCLVRLGNVCKNDVHHRHKHAILLRMSCILDDRNDVCTLLRHVNEVTAGSLGKFNRINSASRANQVRDVRHSCTGSGSQV